MITLAEPILESEFRERYQLLVERYRAQAGDALLQRLDWRAHLDGAREVVYFGVPQAPSTVAAVSWSTDDQVWEWHGGMVWEGTVWAPADLSRLPHHADQIDLSGTVLWHEHTIDDLFRWAECFSFPIAFAPWPTWVLPRAPVDVHLRSFSHAKRRRREAARYSVTTSHDVAGLIGRAATCFGEDFLCDAYGIREQILSAPTVPTLHDWGFDVITASDDAGPASEVLLLTHRDENAALAYLGWDRWDARGASSAIMLELLRFMQRKELTKTYLMRSRSAGKRAWRATAARLIDITTGARRDWF
jgi:hypothetical protein